MDKIKQLKKLIDEANNIVFFSGAGISTLSGIKDFRSPDGLYNMKYKYPPEQILSHSFFLNNSEEFYIFYKDKMNCLDKLPNICHKYLIQLEKDGKLKGIITQNIDGLHTKAGSKNVYELHGTIYKNRCLKCNKIFGPDEVFNSKDIVPRCACGGILKPEVVLYEEGLDYDILVSSINLISKADLLIVAGSSLTVYPASGLLDYFTGKNLVIINKDKTTFDKRATLVINDDLKKVFENL